MIIFIKILLAVICSGLFWWGGYAFLASRRFIMPFILTCATIYFTHYDWWALTMLSCMAVFCLGYGLKSPIRHSLGNAWGRSVWGLLGALGLSLGVFLSGHLIWYLWIIYLIVNFTLENSLKNINQKIGDPIIGLGFASIIFMVH